jgi:uncharacterized membrane protein YhhN
MPYLLLLLWLIWAGLLGSSFGGERPAPAALERQIKAGRIASSVTLVIAAVLLALGQAGTIYFWLIAAGMILGLIGDLFMARLLPLRKAEMGGMAAFGLGHIAYIGAISHFSPVDNLTGQPVFWLGWLLWLILGSLGWYGVVWRGQTAGLLHKLALPYTLLLASTAGVGMGLALVDGRFLPLAIGGALFLLSDLLIALRLFRGNQRPRLNDLIWLTYGLAQMLIVFNGWVF